MSNAQIVLIVIWLRYVTLFLHFPFFCIHSITIGLFTNTSTVSSLLLDWMNKENCSAIEAFRNAWRGWVKDTWGLNSKRNDQLVEGKPVERLWTVYLFVAAWRTYDWPKLYRLLSIQPQRVEGAHYSFLPSIPVLVLFHPFPLFKFPSLCCQTLSDMAGYLGASFTVCVS